MFIEKGVRSGVKGRFDISFLIGKLICICSFFGVKKVRGRGFGGIDEIKGFLLIKYFSNMRCGVEIVVFEIE